MSNFSNALGSAASQSEILPAKKQKNQGMGLLITGCILISISIILIALAIAIGSENFNLFLIGIIMGPFLEVGSIPMIIYGGVMLSKAKKRLKEAKSSVGGSAEGESTYMGKQYTQTSNVGTPTQKKKFDPYSKK